LNKRRETRPTVAAPQASGGEQDSNGQKFFVSFFQKRKRFFLEKEAKTFICQWVRLVA